ncbi:MAG: PKD domain-containing protein [Methanofollis sp.]|nr:PKD domain-containing protein [Methanofollis sp.]
MNSYEEAVSEEIAAVLLIAVFVAAAAVAGLALLSVHPGSAPPAMLVHLEDDALADGRIVLSHDGGDPLERGHFQIFVNGRDLTDVFTTSEGSATWTAWKNGEVLVLEGQHELTDLRIVGDGVGEDGSRWLLHILRDGGGIYPDPPVIPTPTHTATPTPPPLVAQFTADPTTGPAPLAIHFTDCSTGSPNSWFWTFSDGETSTVQNPTHTYDAPGTYTVSLTVRNSAGADTTSRTVTVTAPLPAAVHDITLVTSMPKGGTLGGTLAFTVTGPWSYIQVGEERLALAKGDQVDLTLMGNQTGTLYLARGTITSFEFPDVQVSVNDKVVGRGTIRPDEIWISGYESLISTLALSVEPETAWTSLVVDGETVLEDWEDRHGIVLSTLMPDSNGVMNLALSGTDQDQRAVFYQGGAEIYTLV